MNVCFEFGALFHSAIRCGKQGGKFKITIHLNSVESFLYCLCSNKICKKINAILKCQIRILFMQSMYIDNKETGNEEKIQREALQ